MKLGAEGLIVAIVAIVVFIIALLYFGKDFLQKMALSLMPNKDAPADKQTGTTAAGDPIVGSDVKYVNPIICALSGKFCDPNDGTNKSTDGYIYINKPGQITQVLCDQPADAVAEAQRLVNKLNSGQDFTNAEIAWAQKCEPTLYSMIKDHGSGA
ncbi:MAG: hypothetical protein OS112_03290 [Methanoregula sp.]|nr:MAG: hypothetical protein OS112_03290 [Methanoregula sp.]